MLVVVHYATIFHWLWTHGPIVYMPRIRIIKECKWLNGCGMAHNSEIFRVCVCIYIHICNTICIHETPPLEVLPSFKSMDMSGPAPPGELYVTRTSLKLRVSSCWAHRAKANQEPRTPAKMGWKILSLLMSTNISCCIIIYISYDCVLLHHIHGKKAGAISDSNAWLVWRKQGFMISLGVKQADLLGESCFPRQVYS